MEVANTHRAFSAPAPGAITPQPPAAISATPRPPPEILAAWPRSAQLAGTFVIGALTTLLGVHALRYLPGGAEPSVIDGARPITYRVDLNEARRAELLQLPGVGPTLADRIEDYRETSGGFRSVDDLKNVQGIGPTALERLRPFVTVKSARKPAAVNAAAPVGKSTTSKVANLNDTIDVNRATVTDLQKLPGIGPVLSQRIVDEREKRAFASVEELRRVYGIGPKTLEKIRPFVAIGDPTK